MDNDTIKSIIKVLIIGFVLAWLFKRSNKEEAKQGLNIDKGGKN